LLWLFIHFIFLSAKALGIKDIVPAYLKPDLQSKDLLTGVGFAFGGLGIDPLASSTLVTILYFYLLSKLSVVTFDCIKVWTKIKLFGFYQKYFYRFHLI